MIRDTHSINDNIYVMSFRQALKKYKRSLTHIGLHKSESLQQSCIFSDKTTTL